MRTSLATAPALGRTTLTAVLVPAGGRPSRDLDLPGAWRQEFGDEAGSSLLLWGPGGEAVLLLRLPRASEMEAEDLREAGGRARLEAEGRKRPGLSLDLRALQSAGAEELAAATEGAVMAGYDPGVKKKERKKAAVKRIQVAVSSATAPLRRALRQATLRAEANLFTREIQNLPSNILTPKAFASRARKVAASSPRITVKVLGEKKMAEMKMGALLGVSRGSKKEAQLVHLRYRPSGKARGRVAVVGKGLIFDSGGISLKPSANMDQMKFDMSGAAAVLGLFQALAAGAECSWEVHGVLACVENMPGGNAQNPGDIVTAMNGTTIEVLNTDAEGRLVLADALTYAARRIQPDRIYDLATLTGACIHALGHLCCAVLGNDEKLQQEVREAGEAVGERGWPLPLWKDYRDLTKGRYADLQNIYPAGQGAGTIAGASFLSWFVDDLPWVHLDIAGVAWEGPKRSYMTAGGRGFGTRLLLELLRR